MALYAAINGLPLVDARISLPRVGVWHADVSLEHDEALAGQVTLELGGVFFQGTVRRAGITAGISVARVVGGGAGLDREATAQGYSDVPVSVPLSDILRLGGESLSPQAGSSITGHQLKHWVRARGRLGPLLATLVASVPVEQPSWRVLADGTVWVGEEGWPEVSMTHILIEDDPRVPRKVLFAETPSILPGQVLEGDRIGYVEHVLDQSIVRTTVWVEND